MNIHIPAAPAGANCELSPASSFGARKWLATGTSLALLIAVLLPIRENWKATPVDGFPFSYFPMFSLERGETYQVTHLVGFDARDQRTLIHHSFAGTGGFNQVRRQIRKKVQNGKAEGLCRSVARRVAASPEAPIAGVNRIQIVTGEYKINEFFAGNRAPVNETVHANCPVERSNP